MYLIRSAKFFLFSGDAAVRLNFVVFFRVNPERRIQNLTVLVLMCSFIRAKILFLIISGVPNGFLRTMSSIIRTAWSVTFLAERALATTGDFLTHLLMDDLETPSSFAVFRVDFNCM
jgi:hypothetical protein